MNAPISTRQPSRVALVTCNEFPDLYEDDRLLGSALEAIGIVATPAVWSDASVDWAAFDAIVIRSPWDYFEHAAEFRSWLDARITSGVLLCNAGDILAWNYDKAYLSELQDRGVALVPTIAIARGERGDIASRVRAKGWDDIVIKPTISGGAYRTHRLRVADLPEYQGEIDQILVDRGLLVQPFLPEILESGEVSLAFFDGVFSHALRKRPKNGDYRVQFQFGGTTEDVDLDPAVVEGARACALAAPSLPVYARVDGIIRGQEFLLMELEVFEPLMYLFRHPEAPARFARAIEGRLRAKKNRTLE
jgi:glutathione synthase/RimK-type ligase-like ATP-grasp enzyme